MFAYTNAKIKNFDRSKLAETVNFDFGVINEGAKVINVANFSEYILLVGNGG